MWSEIIKYCTSERQKLMDADPPLRRGSQPVVVNAPQGDRRFESLLLIGYADQQFFYKIVMSP